MGKVVADCSISNSKYTIRRPKAVSRWILLNEVQPLKLSKNAYKTSFNGIQYNISFCLLIAYFQFEIEQFFPIKNNVFKWKQYLYMLALIIEIRKIRKID